MAIQKKSYAGYDVSGASGGVILKAAGAHKNIVESVLAKSGIWNVDSDLWYPLDVMLSVFAALEQQVGGHTLFAIGKLVPSFAELPPGLDNIEAMLSGVNIAYHLNHRYNGRVMFDPATGKTLDGIGCYSYRSEGPRRGTMFCENPYPGEFDRGLVTASARLFEPTAEVERDPTKPSRLKGGDSCTFLISW